MITFINGIVFSSLPGSCNFNEVLIKFQNYIIKQNYYISKLSTYNTHACQTFALA